MPHTVRPPHPAQRANGRAFHLLLLFIATFHAAIGTLFAAAPLSGSEAARAFNLPADEARTTLRLFTEQSGRGLVVDSETVRDVRTNAVHGNFTPPDALGRLLAGTPLVATQDPQSGAFAVRREPEPPARAPRSMQSGPSSTGSIEGRVKNVVSGRYLQNARVSIASTDILVFTDETGRYRIARAPAGRLMIEVYYTGLDVEHVSIDVASGETITQDVGLTNAALFGAKDATVRLNPFTVASAKETDMATIAINEQRFAPNIKNVVSTDSHGEVLSGNIGEFLKYIPGVDGGGGAYEPGGIQIRGFPANFTGVTADGAPLANSDTANAVSNRTFSLATISINNVSRVEVTKVPTPSTPADSLAGSVNMISKSAFESDRTQFRYSLAMTSSASTLHFSKQPRADETYAHYVKPSANFDLILPVNKNFGLTLAAQRYMVSSPLNRGNRTFNATAVGSGATFSRPYFQQQQNPITTQFRTRDSGSLKVDWRVTRHSVFSASYQFSRFDQDSMNYSFQAQVGAAATPSVANGVPLTFGPDFTFGATGRGAVGQTAGINVLHNTLGAGIVNYRYDNGDWKVDAMVTRSKGRSQTNNEADGFFRNFQTSAKVPVRVSFFDVNDYGPGRIEMFTNENRKFDFYDINNFDLNLTGVGSQITDVRNGLQAGAVNIKRRLNLLPFPTAVQVGWAGREQTLDRQDDRPQYTYNGVNGDRSAAPFAAKVYYNVEQPMITGIERNPVDPRGVPYASSHLAWQTFLKNPALFSQTPAQLVTQEQTRMTNSQYFRETVNALYAQTEMRLLKNRLNLLAGVRFEKTANHGEGVRNDASAVFVRNADGSFARNAAGARIRKPEAGAAGSMADLKLRFTERGYEANRTYDGYYPSVHLTYNITEKLLARAAFAKTYGRPNYTEIIPNTVANENDLGDVPNPNAVLGTLTVKNTGLLPWSASNYDLSLEYYTESGGVLGASVFHKEITDFFGTFARVATAADLAVLGLGPEYAGWQVNTTINAGDAKVSGFEVSLNHSLRPLGKWGQYFRGFANFTQIEVKGPREADFRGFLPKTANWGLTYNKPPFIVMTKWNYRSDVQQDPIPALGPDAYNYLKGDVYLDLNISYQVRKHVSLFFNAGNATGKKYTIVRQGSETPEYAKVYMKTYYGGAILNAGVKGSF